MRRWIPGIILGLVAVLATTTAIVSAQSSDLTETQALRQELSRADMSESWVYVHTTVVGLTATSHEFGCLSSRRLLGPTLAQLTVRESGTGDRVKVSVGQSNVRTLAALRDALHPTGWTAYRCAMPRRSATFVRSGSPSPTLNFPVSEAGDFPVVITPPELSSAPEIKSGLSLGGTLGYELFYATVRDGYVVFVAALGTVPPSAMAPTISRIVGTL